MKGAKILLNGDECHGRFIEGIINDASPPGIIMEMVPAMEPINGRFTYRHASIGSNGDRRPIYLLLEDAMQGVTPDINGLNVYTAGRRGFLYMPIPGDEFNVLVKGIAGTGNHMAIGDKLMVEAASGKLIAGTGAAVAQPFEVQQTMATPMTSDTLVWVRYT